MRPRWEAKQVRGAPGGVILSGRVLDRWWTGPAWGSWGAGRQAGDLSSWEVPPSTPSEGAVLASSNRLLTCRFMPTCGAVDLGIGTYSAPEARGLIPAL